MCMDAPNPKDPIAKLEKDINSREDRPLSPGIQPDHELKASEASPKQKSPRPFDIHVSPIDHRLVEQADQVINTILKMMVEKRASDLHLRAGTPLILRIDGNLVALDKMVISPELAREVL